jgi:hypothetical protein
MKKYVLFLMFISLAALLTAQSVTVGHVSGKVELQQPGMGWQTASAGMTIPSNSKISTGFASEAVVVMDNANITVRPLTRMTLEEFSSSGDTTTTKLFLGSGRIRTDVKKSERRINDFQVRSPVATAAVRGTSFTFDGLRIEVQEGNVDFYGKTGAKVSVPEGSSSHASEEGGPVSPSQQKKRDSGVSPSTAAGEDTSSPDSDAETFDSARSPATSSSVLKASLDIIIQ